MLAPSKAIPLGESKVGNVPSTAPWPACNLVTVLAEVFATQMLDPSKTTPPGPFPTGKLVVTLARYHRKIAMALGLSAPDAAGPTSAVCADKEPTRSKIPKQVKKMGRESLVFMQPNFHTQSR